MAAFFSSSSSLSVIFFFVFFLASCLDYYPSINLASYSLILKRAFLEPVLTQLDSSNACSATLRLSFFILRCFKSIQSLTHQSPLFSGLMSVDISKWVRSRHATSYCLSFSRKSTQFFSTPAIRWPDLYFLRNKGSPSSNKPKTPDFLSWFLALSKITRKFSRI